MPLFLFIVIGVCIAQGEARERTASLVVLPPLVLGYDEFYENDNQKPNNHDNEIKRDFEQPDKHTNHEENQHNHVHEHDKGTNGDNINKHDSIDLEKPDSIDLEDLYVDHNTENNENDDKKLTFVGNFVLPHKLFTCPCHKDKPHV